MAKFLQLIAGVPKMITESSSIPVYEQTLTVVSGTAANSNEVQGPISAGTNLTLPQSGTYSGDELWVFLSGEKMYPTYDYVYVGSGTRTQIQFLFDLVIGDIIEFKTERGA